jgi:hypothetical protein
MRKNVQVLSVTHYTEIFRVSVVLLFFIVVWNIVWIEVAHFLNLCPHSEPESCNGRISHNPDHIVSSSDMRSWTDERIDSHLSHRVPKNELGVLGTPRISMCTSGRRVMGWAFWFGVTVRTTHTLRRVAQPCWFSLHIQGNPDGYSTNFFLFRVKFFDSTNTFIWSRVVKCKEQSYSESDIKEI